MPRILNWKYAYCLFCRSGTEEQLVSYIEERIPDVQAIATYKCKHKTYKGATFIEQVAFLPGYIFLYTLERISKADVKSLRNAYKILGYDQEETLELEGSDFAFAQWIWDNDGVIGVSKIRIINDDVTILSGPMLKFASDIVRIDKHTKNALVNMAFHDCISEMWLAFDFEDEQTEEK